LAKRQKTLWSFYRLSREKEKKVDVIRERGKGSKGREISQQLSRGKDIGTS